MTYEERYKDLNLHKAVLVTDDRGKPVQLEAYGRRFDGTTAWVLLHLPEGMEFRVAAAEG